MKREEYRAILDVFITCDMVYPELYRILWGGCDNAISLKQEGLFSKIQELEFIIRDNSVYADKNSDEDLEEFINIIDSTELTLDEKVDKLFRE
jgi:hypothetical protein